MSNIPALMAQVIALRDQEAHAREALEDALTAVYTGKFPIECMRSVESADYFDRDDAIEAAEIRVEVYLQQHLRDDDWVVFDHQVYLDDHTVAAGLWAMR